MTDPINPGYYQRGDAQLIDFLETLPYNRGAAGKYIIRAGDKDPAKTVEDLEKALWYVRRELARLGHPDEADLYSAWNAGHRNAKLGLPRTFNPFAAKEGT